MNGMQRSVRVWATCWLATSALSGAMHASAQGIPDFTIDLPAGVACSGFDVRIEARGDLPAVRELPAKNGAVRLISAGRGWALTVINLNSGASVNLRPNGSVSQVRLLPDGSQQWSAQGHNLVIWFPSDIPAGPWTRLYVGQLNYTVAADGIFTLGKTSGKVVDICAALS
jgi:hypothetical protein